MYVIFSLIFGAVCDKKKNNRKGFTSLQFQVRTYEGACKFSVLFPHIEYAGNSVVQTDSSI